MATLPSNVSTTAAKSGHDIVATLAFELIGVSIMAIIADSNDTMGTIMLILMLSFLFYWLITKGSGILNKAVAPWQSQGPHSPHAI